jgi:hypothetical protein
MEWGTPVFLRKTRKISRKKPSFLYVFMWHPPVNKPGRLENSTFVNGSPLQKS